MDERQRELWEAALRAKGMRVTGRRDAGQQDAAASARGDVHGKPRAQQGGQPGKGIGPNKACGHKGGICRQGSKRG